MPKKKDQEEQQVESPVEEQGVEEQVESAFSNPLIDRVVEQFGIELMRNFASGAEKDQNGDHSNMVDATAQAGRDIKSGLEDVAKSLREVSVSLQRIANKP